MRIFIKELTKVLEQKEKAVYLYNTTGNALPLLSAVDQMEKYIGKIILIRERDMYDSFNGYDDENAEDDIYSEEDFDDEDDELNEDELDDDLEEDFYDEEIDGDLEEDEDEDEDEEDF